MQLEFLRPARRVRAGIWTGLCKTSKPTVYVPLLLGFAAAIGFHLTEADLALSRLFYDADTTSWPCFKMEPFRSLYCFGCLPSLAIGIGGLVVALFGNLWQPTRPFRKEGLYLAVLLILGPGILVNAVLKPNWGRPRPIQVADFGGDRDFVAVGLMGPCNDSKSFPSGHAAMGFFLMAPGFVLLRRNRRAAHAFFTLGLLYGGLMSVTRVAQGGHFPSDVIASGLIVYFTGLILYFAMGFHRDVVVNTAGTDVEPVPVQPNRRRAA